jgi:hypothetical protein
MGLSRSYSRSEKRQHVLNMVSDLVSNFLYYDRKNDEEYRPGEIEEDIVAGAISTDEIIEKFSKELIEGVQG